MPIYGCETLKGLQIKIYGGEIIETNAHRWKSMVVNND